MRYWIAVGFRIYGVFDTLSLLGRGEVSQHISQGKLQLRIYCQRDSFSFLGRGEDFQHISQGTLQLRIYGVLDTFELYPYLVEERTLSISHRVNFSLGFIVRGILGSWRGLSACLIGYT
jgi:hypothetical protein